MADYVNLNSIPHAGTRAAVKRLMDRLNTLEAQLAESRGKVTEPLAAALDANGQAVQNLPDPVHPTDAVHLKAMQQFVAATTAPRNRTVNPDLTQPVDISDGHTWTEATGTSPSRVIAMKTMDGGVVRTIASVTI